MFLKYQDVINPTEEILTAISRFLEVKFLTTICMPSFEELNRSEPKFFRSGSETNNILELLGDDLDLFWWIHGRKMLELGFVEIATHSIAEDNQRKWFLNEIENFKKLSKAKSNISKDLNKVRNEISNLEKQRLKLVEENLSLKNRLIHLTRSKWEKLVNRIKSIK